MASKSLLEVGIEKSFGRGLRDEGKRHSEAVDGVLDSEDRVLEEARDRN